MAGNGQNIERMTAEESFATEITAFVPDDAQALIWAEFYGSRGRGRSLGFHSPWIDSGQDLSCVLVRGERDRRLLGTLVVKPVRQHAELRCAMVGYVCVAPEQRGRGIGRLMLDRAVRHAGEAGYDALLLWTGVPEVYRRHGFVVRDTDIFDRYPPLHLTVPPAAGEPRETDWPSSTENWRGPPAFAERARRVDHDGAHIIILDTANGPAIAEWGGDTGAVLSLIAATCPHEWWLNALRGDDLLAALERLAVRPLDRRASAMMVLPLGGTVLADIPGVRILDRI